MQALFLDKVILRWHANSDSSNWSKQEGWNRPYDYLEIAYKIIKSHRSEIELIDCISNLKRAIDHRIKKLVADYQLKRITSYGFPKGDLDKLAALGIAKPAIIQHIRDVRNIIEHQFKDSPGVKRCSELADFTWYFLRSTDELCRCISTDILLSDNHLAGKDSKIWVRFVMPNDEDFLWKKFEFVGVLNKSYVVESSKQGFPAQAFGLALHKDRSVKFQIEESAFQVLEPTELLAISGSYFFEPENGGDIIKSYFNLDRIL